MVIFLFDKTYYVNFFKHLGALGSYEVYLLFSFFFILLEEYYIAFFLFFGFFLLYLIAVPIRLLFFKERPIPIEYKNIFGKIKASSFPSMHSSRFTFLILVLLYYFNFNFSFFLFFGFLWFIVLYSRIFNKKHTFVDLIGGIFLAFIIFIFILNFIYFTKII